MTEKPKNKVGRPKTGVNTHLHTITLDKGLLEQIKQLNPEFKLSTFVNEQLRVKLAELEG